MNEGYLVFETEQDAINANNQMFFNWIKLIADDNNGKICINAETKEEVLFNSLTFEEIISLPVFGYRASDNVRNYRDGFVLRCSIPKKAYNQEKWWIHKYLNLMTNVENVFEEINDIPQEWLEPNDNE